MKSASAPESHPCQFYHPERMLLENALACAIADTGHINTNPRCGVRSVFLTRPSY